MLRFKVHLHARVEPIRIRIKTMKFYWGAIRVLRNADGVGGVNLSGEKRYKG